MTDAGQAAQSPWLERARQWHARAVEPRADGLPNRRVVAAPLLALAAVFVGMVVLGLTGTSTGIVHSWISNDTDSRLILDDPQAIRSDEWFVQTTWTISQVEQGLPLRNDTFPGGMDATVQHDLPTLDWSTAFRPHLWGFLFLPLDNAMAVKWWLPGFALIASVYLFAVTLMPRRPVASAALAVGFFFAPFFQWWYLSITFYPPAWAFLVMATVVWALRSATRRPVWILAAVAGYVTVTVGTGIYAPFIIPAALVALAFGLGSVLMPRGPDDTFGARVRDVVPLLIAGGVGAMVLAVWILTRWETIVGFTSTVYPGERLQETGQAGLRELGALLSGPLSAGLERSGGLPFGANSSEASTFLLPGLFLVVVLVWLIIDRARRGRGIDWLSICVLAIGLVMVAFMFLPGWDAIAHLLFLDRTTYGRIRLGFGILSLVMIILATVRLTERSTSQGVSPVPRIVPLGAVLLAVAATAIMLWAAAASMDVGAYLPTIPRSIMLAGVLILAAFVVTVGLFAFGKVTAGALLLLVLSVGSTVSVNPLYRGVLDLRDTQAVAEIERLAAEDPGTWVGINTSPLPTMMLVESGTRSLNGFQSAPSPQMWSQIDPSGQDEAVWNRLANVGWVAGEGAPDPRNPAPDQIQMTFDSCDVFAQNNVTWVLSETSLDQACVTPVTTVTEGPTTLHFYRVVPAG